jgi:hypothetical protein
MFSKHADSKVVHMTITYTDPKDMPISCMCFHPEISERLDIPCTPSIACPSIAAGSQSTQPLPSHPKTSQYPAELTMIVMMIGSLQVEDKMGGSKIV